MNNDVLLSGETKETLTDIAAARARMVLEDMSERTWDAGLSKSNRAKVQEGMLTEVLLQTYLEGRSSAIVSSALREAREARTREAVECVTATVKMLSEAFRDILLTPLQRVARKFLYWAVGVAAVEAAAIAALVYMLATR